MESIPEMSSAAQSTMLITPRLRGQSPCGLFTWELDDSLWVPSNSEPSVTFSVPFGSVLVVTVCVELPQRTRISHSLHQLGFWVHSERLVKCADSVSIMLHSRLVKVGWLRVTVKMLLNLT